MVDSQSIRQLTHDLGEAFIAEYYPEEIGLYSLIWESFQNSSSGPPIAGGRGKGLSTLAGFRFAESRNLTLISPIAILTVNATLFELQAIGISPDLPKIQEMVRACAFAGGATKSVARELAVKIAPKIERAVVEGVFLSAEPRIVTKPSDQVFVDRLSDGQIIPMEITPLNQAIEESLSHSYLFVVNEIDGICENRTKQERKHFREIGGIQRGILWLCLTHPGVDLVESDFDSIFNFGKLDIGSKRNRIHTYVWMFRDFVGERLRMRIITQGRKKFYPISRLEWSFYWIRVVPETNRSRLLQGVGNPSEYQ